jgi:hypothetical protein
LTFRQPDDRYCELRVFGGEAMSANHPLLPRATRILTAFGQYWSAWPESVPRTSLTIADLPHGPHSPRPKQSARNDAA